jgi:hypothetical protein
MYVYFSDNDQYYDLHDKDSMVWKHAALTYDWNENNNIEKSISFPPSKVISFLLLFPRLLRSPFISLFPSLSPHFHLSFSPYPPL